MLRYVLSIARDPRNPDPQLAPPGAAATWRCAWRTQLASLWLKASRSKLQGGPAPGGYVLGLPDAAASQICIASDASTGAVTVLRDAGGAIPAYYHRGVQHHVVCSHVEDLAAYGQRLDIDWAYLAHYLLNDMLAPRRAGLTSVEEILPGERLILKGDDVRWTADWTPARSYQHPIHELDQARRSLRAAADASVAAWSAPYGRVTLDLSGGLDSAAILGLLRQTKPATDIHCLNYANAHAESDELAFAHESAQLHGVELVEVRGERAIADLSRTAPPLVARPSILLARIGFDALATDICREVGAEGFFTGRGGDHLFGTSVGLLYPADYLRARRDPFGWLRHAYQAAQLTGMPLRDVVRRTFSSAGGLAEVIRALGFQNQFAARDAMSEAELTEFAHPWLLEALDRAPPARLRQVIDLIELQRHYMRFGRAEIADEIHPFISPGVVKASLGVATHLFPLGGVKRGLQREVFRDLIPDSIYRRRTKGATTSQVAHTIRRNLAHLRERLLDGGLARRGLIDRKLLDAKLTDGALLDGRFLGELVVTFSAQVWLDSAEAFLAEQRRATVGRPASTTDGLAALPV